MAGIEEVKRESRKLKKNINKKQDHIIYGLVFLLQKYRRNINV